VESDVIGKSSRVDYELTAVAKDLIPIWSLLSKWGKKHRALLASLAQTSLQDA